MDTETRLAKVEVEVESCKEGIARVEGAIAELRTSMENGFAEQRASVERALAEQRKEANARFHWLLGLIFTNMTFTFGIIVHITRTP